MSRFEQTIENMKKDNTVPERVQEQFQNALNSLPEHKKGTQWKRFVAAAAMFVMMSGVVLTGGTALASKIPFLGRIFAEVEQLHFFSGDYDDKAQVVEKTEDTEAEHEGIKITASEIYSDGFSVYVTAEIVVEEGGLNNIPGDIERKNMYMMGSYQLEGDDIVYDMENDNLYGKIVDDHTFIGMTKLDLEDVYVQEGVLNWNLSMIGYDDVEMTEENGIAHRIEGEWKVTLPFNVDTEDTKTVEVNYSENEIVLDKVVVTPYQLAIFTELAEVDSIAHVVVFNQDGEMLEWQNGMEISKFSIDGEEINKLYIYVFDDFDLWMTMHKSGDMNHEVSKEAKLFAEVSIE